MNRSRYPHRNPNQWARAYIKADLAHILIRIGIAGVIVAGVCLTSWLT